LVAIASMVLCYLATIYPARQASRETPVEVFRS
jgi:ABC-type lipoprotein release transport system permease subunit